MAIIIIIATQCTSLDSRPQRLSLRPGIEARLLHQIETVFGKDPCFQISRLQEGRGTHMHSHAQPGSDRLSGH